MSTGSNAGGMALPVTVHAQYIKDLSFENPNPIASFTTDNKSQPNISVGIQAKADNLGGRNFEVVLDIRIDATRDKASLFIAELSYAGIVTLGDEVEENDAGHLLMVESPRLLFPFARNILADVTRDGGFPPLMLAPVDFSALYEQQKDQQKPTKAEKGSKADKSMKED
ncbi:MAG: protein-export chaperone SecB [Alphaproteobacteria bacterium]|nr:protein-export chaperone SecB [Alphaproteobacteria bacterium]